MIFVLRRNFFLLGRDRGSNPRQGELYHSKSSAPSRIAPQGRGYHTLELLKAAALKCVATVIAYYMSLMKILLFLRILNSECINKSDLILIDRKLFFSEASTECKKQGKRKRVRKSVNRLSQNEKSRLRHAFERAIANTTAWMNFPDIGQAHHMFSRFLNLQFFHGILFVLFFFKV